RIGHVLDDEVDLALRGETEHALEVELALHVLADHSRDHEPAGRVGPVDAAVRAHHDVVWAVELLALVVGRGGGERAVMLDAPDRALRPARNVEPAFAIERHAVGMAGRVHQRLGADARRPLVDGVADDVGPQEALLAAVPHRAFAEGEAVRDLIERRRLARDAVETGRGEIDIQLWPPESSVPGRRPAGWVGDAAIVPPERPDAHHLVVAQREIEYGEIFCDPLRVRRTRYRRDGAVLDRPAQGDLRHRPALAACDLADDPVVD